MHRKILAPVDGSTPSEFAIPFVVETARRANGSVLLLRTMPESLVVTNIPVSIKASARRVAERDLDRLIRADGTNEVPVTADLRIAFPVEGILRASTVRRSPGGRSRN